MYFSAILDFAKRLPIPKQFLSQKSQGLHLLDQQGNRIKELGFLLREARNQKLLSLEEAAAQTLIRVGLLSAIEAGNLRELPEPVYVQALLRQYANFLGLDGDRLADSIPSSHFERTSEHSWKFVLPLLTQLRPMHLYLIYIILMAVAVNSLSAVVENSRQRETPLAMLPPMQESVKVTTPQPTISPSPSPVQRTQPIVVNVTFKSQSWIRAIADDKTLFEGVLEEGSQKTWTAQTKLSIRAGNAGAILVAFNEDKPQIMGNPGEVQELSFTPNSGQENSSQTNSSQTNANPNLNQNLVPETTNSPRTTSSWDTSDEALGFPNTPLQP